MMTVEQWLRCPSYPTLDASSWGRIRNAETLRVRNASPNKLGYTSIGFWQGKKLIARSVHHLVADAFLGPKQFGAEIRHLDGNSRNNAPHNLAYGTAKENARDRLDHGRNAHGQRNGMAKLPDVGVRVIRAAYAAGVATQYELADLFGISQAQVNNIVLNKQRQREADAA
jgi:hypothetical protein